MADKVVKITFEIDGLEQSVTNIDDAKAALQQLETQAKKTEDAAEKQWNLTDLEAVDGDASNRLILEWIPHTFCASCRTGRLLSSPLTRI